MFYLVAEETRNMRPVKWLVLLTGLSMTAAAQERPNILLIVADDLAYTDLGVYGGEIRTPNIDALANSGLTFSQFNTSPVCAATRAMLLSGNNNHVAGLGRMHATGPVQAHLPGYGGYLSDLVAPLPLLLGNSGYRTYMVGKWHLGFEAEHSPKAAGFERSFSLLHGGASHFSGTGFSEGGSQYREDDESVAYPDGHYSTALYTDLLIDYLESGRADGRPFFAYAAYTSPHWPLQVPDEFLDLYGGAYDAGYDVLRERRFESAKRAGVIPPSSVLPPRNDAIALWSDLSAEQQRIEARKMELYAAMVENLDHHVGRLIDYLRASGLYENTLIVFMSDNGAAHEDLYRVWSYLREHYDNSYDNMGEAGSWVSYGPQWAEAGSAPFSRHKGYTREGGIRAPLIVSGPNVAPLGEITSAYVTVMDLAPTFLELGSAEYPSDDSVRPMLGESINDLLQGATTSVHAEDYVTGLYHAGRAYLRQGNWKLVNLDPPFDDADFQLYDVESDIGEMRDLAESEPARFASMLNLWRTMRRQLGIVLPEDL